MNELQTMIRLVERRAKTIFTPTKLPDTSYTINQYVGCGHACLYCYAKFMCRWKQHGEWGSWVEVKVNAPELVKLKHPAGNVYMSSVSDPYQPIEKELQLTRRVLLNMDKGVHLSVQTKSNLILRDIDVLLQFENIDVGLTINGFSGKLKKIFEPYSSTHRERLQTLKILKAHGINTYGFISPIIPGVTNVGKVIDQSSEFVDYYWLELLNLRASGSKFNGLLKAEFPQSYVIMKHGMYEFIDRLRQMVCSKGVNLRGIVVHYPKFGVIR